MRWRLKLRLLLWGFLHPWSTGVEQRAAARRIIAEERAR